MSPLDDAASGSLDRHLIAVASAHLTRWSAFVTVLFLLVVNVFVFRGVYFGDDSFPFDFPQAHYGFVAYWIASVAHGEWPQWIPYQGMGYAFASNLESGAFYPIFWPLALGQVGYTLHVASVVQALHALFGGLGVYVLARALFGSSYVSFLVALCFSIYGGFFTNAEHPDIVRAFALTPWLFWSLLFRDSGLASVQRHERSDRPLICRRNLLIPVVFYFFISGSYTGNLIATAFLLPWFLGAQCVQRIRAGSTPPIVLRDTVGLVLLLALGSLLASAYLIPGLALSQDLTRATEYTTQAKWRLRVEDFSSLVFSSRTAPGQDYSMIGMQLPAPLFLFIPLISRLHARALWPFAVVTLVAFFMCLAPFKDLVDPLIKLFPPLGYSRFPAGDYRTTGVLGIVLFLGAGLHTAWHHTSPMRHALWLAPAVGIALAIAAMAVLLRSAPELQASQARMLMLQLAPMIPALAVLVLRFPRLNPSTATAVLAVCCVVSALPALENMAQFWRYPHAEQALSSISPVPLWQADKPPASTPFERELVARPPRVSAADFTWRGYLTGDFMMDDKGGLVTTARRSVEANPDLQAYMLSASRPIVLACSDQSNCTDVVAAALHRAQVPSEATAGSVRTTTYRRNELTYVVDAQEPVLLVENEVFMPGWRGSLTTDGQQLEVEPVRMLGALRAWRLPAGSTVLRLRYEAPYFLTSIALSLAALAAYGCVLAALGRRVPWTRRRGARE